MRRLDGKVAVVTGGSSGIGLAIAKTFVEEGAYVFIMGRRLSELSHAEKEIGQNVTGVQGDIACLDDLDRLYETVKRMKGGFDVLIANAGVAELASIQVITEAHYARIFDVNVRGTLFTVQKALPLLRDSGSIVLIGSMASIRGVPEFGVYSASKAAIRSFVRTWTVELKERRIRSNVISPGTVDTPILNGLSSETIELITSGVPMGRLGQPIEIAKTALFLASNESSFISGVELFVDGGTAQV